MRAPLGYTANEITPWELFRQVPARGRLPSGAPFVRWMPIGMPQLGKYGEIVDSVFFLYPTREHAERGTGFGGTGFFVAYPAERWPERSFSYAVSNWHVVRDRGCCFVRLNRRDGGTDVIETGPEEWTSIPGTNDVVVRHFPVDNDIHRVKSIGVGMFYDPANNISNIGPGDDVLMVGRFVDYEQTETNEPALRFGHISILSAPVPQPTGSRLPSVIADVHSRSGFSGSPVFAYRTTGSVFLAGGIGDQATWELPTGHMFRLLGIHWGQFPEQWELRERPKQKSPTANAALTVNGSFIDGVSGMTCVVPASAIRELLDLPKLAQERRELEEEAAPQIEALARAEDS